MTNEKLYEELISYFENIRFERSLTIQEKEFIKELKGKINK